MKKYFITGVPGIGKTTIAKELGRKGFTIFDVDQVNELCQWVNSETDESAEFLHGAGADWLDKHSWNCNITKLDALMNSQGSEVLFVSGITSNQDDYLNLFDKIFLLQADEATFMNRMSTRGDDHFGYNEADRRHVLGWYKGFEERMVRKGAAPIDASKPIDAIISEITLDALRSD